MTTFQILTLLGGSSIAFAIFGGIFAYVKRIGKSVKAISLGLQAVLRSQMIADYNKWSERGWAPIYAKDNFENCWNQYETLGANGVMNNVRSNFLALPDSPPDQQQ